LLDVAQQEKKNLTEGTGAEKRHVKDPGAHRTCKRADSHPQPREEWPPHPTAGWALSI